MFKLACRFLSVRRSIHSQLTTDRNELLTADPRMVETGDEKIYTDDVAQEKLVERF